ncbi:glycosyltransferase family 4 protein [Allofustis seminis]|uniref:glycosyltransferase family 4 protein n=1 Tax=Allofustis seminis TaxID=166939 RepID=UPI00035C2AC1|nr:glycosyltransferase family 4 protein [Allofustis seminis]
MRVLIATETYKPAINGVVTSTLTLKEALEAAGHEVYVLTLGAHDSEDPIHHVCAVRSFSVNKLYPGARLSFAKTSPYIRKLVDWHPDIIHTQGEFSTFRIAQAMAHALDIPIVHTYHTIYEDYTHYFSPSRRLGKKIVETLSRELLERTAQIIAPTPKVSAMLHGYGIDIPITVIPTGLNLKQFSERIPQEKRQQVRQQLGIEPDDFVLVSLARVAKEKNIDELIRYMKQLDEAHLKLLIVGDGPYRAALEELVETLALTDKVRFAGMVRPEEVSLYYQLGDLFVSASTSETQGLTYIEALASGLPALCRQDDSIDGVIEDGKNGYQYQNFDQFKKYLESFVHQPMTCSTMGQAARQSALDHYSAEAFAKKVLEVYQRAIDND